jgi:hypothetical protein
MGYIFFRDGQWPTPEETAPHFLKVLHYFFYDENCHIHFRDEVLKPYAAARLKFENEYPHVNPENAFVGGIFLEVNGLSVWKTLMKSELHSHKILLGILDVWGFSEPNEYGWSNAKAKRFYNMLSPEYFALGVEHQ